MELDRESWDRFVAENHGSFLQSWQWGQFQHNIGRNVRRFALQDGEAVSWDDFLNETSNVKLKNYNPDGIVQFIEMPLPFGKAYWYAPRGPVVRRTYYPNVPNLRYSVKEGHIVFVRFDPAWPPECENIFIENGWWQTHDVQPRQNWVLDITKLEQELLAAMHPKTRYNIRLAQEECIVRQSGKSVADVEVFLKLVAETSRRHSIRSHPAEHYRKMLETPIAELWLAEYKDELVAAHIVIFFGSRATYLHGGSFYEHRALMAPHLLHWGVIKEAQRRGLTEYDFGGVDPERWPGLTRFKKGFGGRDETFVGAFDYPLKPLWYKLYQMTRWLKR